MSLTSDLWAQTHPDEVVCSDEGVGAVSDDPRSVSPRAVALNGQEKRVMHGKPVSNLPTKRLETKRSVICEDVHHAPVQPASEALLQDLR